MPSTLELLLGHSVDWQAVVRKGQSIAPCAAGAIFGMGCAFWADALIYSYIVLGFATPAQYYLPGGVAVFALLLINCSRREDLQGDTYEDEYAQCRVRVWLLIAYVVAAAAVGGSVAVLLTCKARDQPMSVGVGAVVHCGLTLLAALVFWLCRPEQESSSYIAI